MCSPIASSVRLHFVRSLIAFVHLAGVVGFALVTHGNGFISCSFRPSPWHGVAMVPFRASIALFQALPQSLLLLPSWREGFFNALPPLLTNWLVVADAVWINYHLALLSLLALEMLLQLLAQSLARLRFALSKAGCN